MLFHLIVELPPPVNLIRFCVRVWEVHCKNTSHINKQKIVTMWVDQHDDKFLKLICFFFSEKHVIAVWLSMRDIEMFWSTKKVRQKHTPALSIFNLFLFQEKCIYFLMFFHDDSHNFPGMYCEEKDTLENLCSQIPGDAQLYSLFRIDAQPIDCPFK